MSIDELLPKDLLNDLVKDDRTNEQMKKMKDFSKRTLSFPQFTSVALVSGGFNFDAFSERFK